MYIKKEKCRYMYTSPIKRFEGISQIFLKYFYMSKNVLFNTFTNFNIDYKITTAPGPNNVILLTLIRALLKLNANITNVDLYTIRILLCVQIGSLFAKKR